jgi:hypothetical protein
VAQLDAALVQHPLTGQDHDQADRHVQEEDPLPADLVGEDAAQQHAHGAARAGDGAPDGECLVPLLALAEGGGEDGQRGR